MDSIIYLATRSQPNTKIHSRSTDPTTLRDMLTRECKFRRSQGAPEVVDCIMECGGNHELIINKAVAEGFIKLNMDQLKMARVGALIPRGRELVPQTDPTEKLRQAEMAKVEARHQRETAQLEYEIVQLQRMKTEEQAKQQEAIKRITGATGGRSPTITLTPDKALAAPATPPAKSASSPSVDSAARAEAIASAAASRAARLSGRPPAAGQTPPSTKAPAPASTVKTPAPPLAAPDPKRPRVAKAVEDGKAATPAGGAAGSPAARAAAKDTGSHVGKGKGKSKGTATEAGGTLASAARDCTADRITVGKEATCARGTAGHSLARAAAKDTGSHVGKGKGKSKDSDSKAEGSKVDGGKLASAARDSTADRSAKAVDGTDDVEEEQGDID